MSLKLLEEEYVQILQDHKISYANTWRIVSSPEVSSLRKFAASLTRKDEARHIADCISSLEENDQQEPIFYFNDLLTKDLTAVVKSAISLGCTCSFDVYIGTFPINSFDAEIRRSTKHNGYIILISYGTWLAVHLFVKTICASTPIPQPEKFGFSNDWSLGTQPIDFETAATRITNIAHSLFVNQDMSTCPKDPLLLGPQLMIQTHLLESVERFVIAHEYSHLIGGHISGSVWRQFINNGLEVDRLDTSWDDEFQADAFGTSILLEPVTFPSINASYSCLAPVVFFGICESLESFRTVMLGQPPKNGDSSHPPNKARAEKIIEVIEAKFGNTIAKRAIRMWEFITDLTFRGIGKVIERDYEPISKN